MYTSSSESLLQRSMRSLMSNYQIQTPVVLMIFNRPENTQKVFEEIRRAKPTLLLVVADGPRPDKPGEIERCEAARTLIEKVDWECEVLKNYSAENMGMMNRQISGLNWVFNTVEEAIILEDDCLPHPTFFRFCEELLERYRDDERIMAIGGTNILTEWKSKIQSYHFAYFGCYWGWACWRRAWQYFDPEMKLWAEPEARDRVRDVIGSINQYKNREKIFDATYNGEIKTWDYQWQFACLLNSGLSIYPSKNLISNLGFNRSATNTSVDERGVGALLTYPMEFPLQEPVSVAIDKDFDNTRYRKTWDNRLENRIRWKTKRLLSRLG